MVHCHEGQKRSYSPLSDSAFTDMDTTEARASPQLVGTVTNRWIFEEEGGTTSGSLKFGDADF